MNRERGMEGEERKGEVILNMRGREQLNTKVGRKR